MTGGGGDYQAPRVNGWHAEPAPPGAGRTEEFPPAWAQRTEEFAAPWVQRIGEIPPPWEQPQDPALPWAQRHAGVPPPRVPRQRAAPQLPAAAGRVVLAGSAATARGTIAGRTVVGTVAGGQPGRGTRRRRASRARRVAVAAVLVVPVVAVLTVLATWHGGDSQSLGPAREGAPTSVLNTALPVAPPRSPDTAVSRPTVIAIPSIGVRSTLQALSLRADGSLDVPTDPRRAGWFADGAAAGARGPAVLVGHVDSRAGPGVFFRLGELRAGAKILVRRADQSTVQFRVVRVRTFAKDAFPTQDVYGPTPGAELRLITCGGPFNRVAGSYRDNVVVFAVRA